MWEPRGLMSVMYGRGQTHYCHMCCTGMLERQGRHLEAHTLLVPSNHTSIKNAFIPLSCSWYFCITLRRRKCRIDISSIFTPDFMVHQYDGILGLSWKIPTPGGVLHSVLRCLLSLFVYVIACHLLCWALGDEATNRLPHVLNMVVSHTR